MALPFTPMLVPLPMHMTRRRVPHTTRRDDLMNLAAEYPDLLDKMTDFALRLRAQQAAAAGQPAGTHAHSSLLGTGRLLQTPAGGSTEYCLSIAVRYNSHRTVRAPSC